MLRNSESIEVLKTRDDSSLLLLHELLFAIRDSGVQRARPTQRHPEAALLLQKSSKLLKANWI